MCRDITFAAAVNSLVSCVFFFYSLFQAAAIIGASVFPGRSSFRVIYLPNFCSPPCGLRNLSLISLAFYLPFIRHSLLFIVTSGVMHLFRRCRHAHVRLQTYSYAHSNIGRYSNSEPADSFYQ